MYDTKIPKAALQIHDVYYSLDMTLYLFVLISTRRTILLLLL